MTASLPATPANLIACPDCDLLQQEIALPAHGEALCQRCAAPLFRVIPNSLDCTIACLLTALLFFALANAYPLVELELKGNTVSSTLYGAVSALASQDLLSVATLVLATTILVPAGEIIAMLYLLIPLKFGRVMPGLPLIFRLVQQVRPWGMIEVFMLGAMVAIVKLSTFARVIPGVALWSCGALMLSLSAAAHFYNPRAVWHAVRLHAE